jgi:hypothetical protein
MENNDKASCTEPRTREAAPTALLTVTWVSCACLLVPILNVVAVVMTPIAAVGLLLSKRMAAQKHGVVCLLIWAAALAAFAVFGLWWQGLESGRRVDLKTIFAFALTLAAGIAIGFGTALARKCGSTENRKNTEE